MNLNLCFISDTHGYHKKVKVPECDILFHTGDYTNRGSEDDVKSFLDWFTSQDQALFKVFINGNHDLNGDSKFDVETGADMWWPKMFNTYHINKPDSTVFHLNNSGVKLLGLNIWGSPVTPDFYPEHWAYNAPRGEKIKRTWDMIPYGQDIIITHGPPAGIRDYISDQDVSVGCEDLRDVIDQLHPRIHAFGHVHEGAGTVERYFTKCINASICNEQYRPVNAPIQTTIDNRITQ